MLKEIWDAQKSYLKCPENKHIDYFTFSFKCYEVSEINTNNSLLGTVAQVAMQAIGMADFEDGFTWWNQLLAENGRQRI